MGSHAAVAAELLGAALVEEVLKDYTRAPISPKERALLAFVERVNAASAEIRKEEVEALKNEGWTEEAIYDAITVCSLFNFYNRWCDAAGVHALPPEGFRASGKRLAKHGYAHDV